MIGYTPKWQHIETGLYTADGDSTSGTGGTLTDPAKDGPDHDKTELESWRQFGLTPDQARVAFDEYMRLSEEEKKWTAKSSEPKPTPKVPATKDEDLSVKIRDEVIRAIPELAKLGDLDKIVERLDAIATDGQQRGIEGARRAIATESAEFVKGLRIDLDNADGQELALAIGEQVEKEIYSDPKLLARFTKGDRTVAEDAIAKVSKSRLIKSLNIPRKAEPRRPFNLGKGSGGDPALSTLAESVSKLPPHQRFAALAEKTFDHVFAED